MSDESKPATKTITVGLNFQQSYVVGGGTPSSAEMNRREKAKADAERRRDELEQDKERARVPVDQGGAVMYTNRLKDTSEGTGDAKVLLRFVRINGGVREPIHNHEGEIVQCLADIIMDAGEGGEIGGLGLIFVCPRCVQQGLSMDESQLLVRQSHRKWTLTSEGAGLPIAFDGQVYMSAGTVCESERLVCSRCKWACHIDKNDVVVEQ